MGGSRILVIGPDHVRDDVARAVPACEIDQTTHALEGVWQSGHEPYHGVFVSLEVGARVIPAVRSLRKVAPRTRIVVGCMPVDEPMARQALDAGADEYVLEPIRRDDLERALRLVGPRARYAPSAVPPGRAHEIGEIGDVIARLDDGSAATLDRLAELLSRTFDSAGASIQFEDLAATCGDVRDPVIEELIARDGKPIGRVALARRRTGVYSTAETARVTEYVRLIEALVSQSRERDRWRELAWTDDLSKLRNRRYFEQRFAELVGETNTRRGQLTLFAFDIDDFKSYNDRYGHDAGDHLIREIAAMLRACTRDRDVVSRFGGDEFAVIFWESEEPRVAGSRHPSDLVSLTERFRQQIEQHQFRFLGADSPGPVTISGGLATLPWDGTSCDQLLRAADTALMNAKRTGKNTIGLAGEVTGRPRTGPSTHAD
jgi:diguanylate cyclase (GGDEF)-like protein